MTYTTRRGVFSFMGATNSAWQVFDEANCPVRIRERGREIGLTFKHHLAAQAAVDLLNGGKPARTALSIGRRADAICFQQADAEARARRGVAA